MLSYLFRPGGSATASALRMLLCATVLSVMGVMVQLAVTTASGADPYALVRRQVIYVLLGVVVGFSAWIIGFQRAVSLARPALVGIWVLLGLLLIPGVAHAGGGARRWIELGSFGYLQPSEVAKLVLVLFFTGFATRRGVRLSDFREGFLPAMAYLGTTAILIAAEPDLGQTVFVCALSSAVLMVNGLRVRHFLPLFVCALPVLFVVMQQKWSYIGARVEGFLSGSHFQVQQGLHFLASGGPFGQSLGDGRAHLFVPAIQNDFALVAVGENGGFVGSALVIVLFAILLHQGLRLALLSETRQGFSVAFGFSFMIALQAAVNLAVVTDLVPPKGISLPFVSYGGSSLLVNAAAIGLVLSAARGARDPDEVFGACPGGVTP